MSMDAPASLNFFKGHPSFRLLPNKEIIDATTDLLSPDKRFYDSDTENRHPLTYGSDQGALWVRNTICSFLNDDIFKLPKDSNLRSTPECLNLNSGASYGILSILLQSTLAQTGYTRQAFIISPTYFLINNCFIDAGFSGKLTAIDEIGCDTIDFVTLEKKLQECENQASSGDSTECIDNPQSDKKKKVYKYVIYTVPTYSNPSGHTYSEETRLRLIKLARKYDMLIIADDVYDILNYDQDISKNSKLLPTPPKRFVHLDRQTWSSTEDDPFGNTISNATFSKLIAPGLRFGYHETVTPKLAYQLSEGGANISGGTPSQLNSMIVGTMLKNGSATNVLRHLISTYKERGEVLYTCVKRWLPQETDCDVIHGGYFVWITLPDDYNMEEIQRRLNAEHNVILANGSNFEVIGDPKGWGKRSARLSISFMEKEEIQEGIRLLGSVCREYATELGLPF
ncbi:similar to Saccharomyces cerevisiae YER152C Protein with 2-aminoadipate transaminase activity [Maudiozyma saulgeensis]|uniref:Similar to Saccharomyces cerevisiae YER152C Protein with 2-aminoadipate transaminase activity n=1 Tax=Maudiozyma saulgeensis TaxID=1789683 RepID=A0A1X7R7M9_9SACH|nr:similar to Saccharomyces cerevisiae YER152C Protein with 2-aminoadipate transaminase activity [Kazachstania saulgeensis]